MKEIVRNQEALEQALPARAIAEKIQLLPAPVEQPVQQPRLVTSRSESKAKAGSAEARMNRALLAAAR